jgi:ferredoxin--NADP+ reductase
MSNFYTEKVLSVHHWNDTLFSFTTTRSQSLRFRNGEFVMLGLPPKDGEKKLMRAYSIASPNYAEHLEFLSIKVPNGQLTSRLQHLEPGNEVIVSKKPTGTLVTDDLRPGKNLYMLATGTGLAPFLSMIQDPDIYDRFDKVILCHGVRYKSELCYQDFLLNELPQSEFLGEEIRQKLIYYPAVTREPFQTQGRLTDLIESQQLFNDLDTEPFDPDIDRAMICGSQSMLKDLSQLLDDHGLSISPKLGVQGDYVIERAFVE